MKQNELQLRNDVSKLQYIGNRTHRQENSTKQCYSPRILIRKKENREIPLNPFTRRKRNDDQSSVFRYLSPKKLQNSQVFSNFGDQSNAENETSILYLNFSRINKKQSTLTLRQSACNQSIFDDLSISSITQKKDRDDQSVEFNRQYSLKNLKQQNTGFSQKSFLQNQHKKNNAQLMKKISQIINNNEILQQNNSKLKIEISDLKKLLKLSESNQLQFKQNLQNLQLTIADNRIQIQKLEVQSQLSKENYQKIINLIDNQFIQIKQQLKNIKIQKQNQYNQLFQAKNEWNFTQNLLKQQIKLKQILLNEIQALKIDNSSILLNYQKKVQDNQKIISKIRNLFCNKQIDQIKYMNQLDLPKILRQIPSQIHYKEYVSLKLDTNIEQINQNYRILKIQFLNLQTLYSTQKQQKHNLYRLIDAKDIEISFMKRKQYDFQKKNDQIKFLKDRNKSLMDKTNSLTIQIQNLKKYRNEPRQNFRMEPTEVKTLSFSVKNNMFVQQGISYLQSVCKCNLPCIIKQNLIKKIQNLSQKSASYKSQKVFPFADMNEQVQFDLSPQKM